METRDVTLPSGETVTIKKPGVLALKQIFGSLPNIGSGMVQSEPTRLDNLEAQISMVCGCCVTPRFHREFPAPAGFRSIDELTIDDFTALSGAVSEFSGVREAQETLDPSSKTQAPS